jgi:hypothetical protein
MMGDMSERILLKYRFGPLPDPEKAKRIRKCLSSTDRERLERGWKVWWDPEKGLVVEPRPS